MTTDPTYSELSVLDAEILPERTVLSIGDLIAALANPAALTALHDNSSILHYIGTTDLYTDGGS